jgi:hypothetical protein
MNRRVLLIFFLSAGFLPAQSSHPRSCNGSFSWPSRFQASKPQLQR